MSEVATVGSSRQYDAVLVPLDGSRIAAQAVPPATSFAREAGCHLLLLHVLPPIEPQVQPLGYENLERERQVRRSQMQAYLEGLKRSLIDTGVTIDVRVLEGDAAGTNLEAARGLGRVMLVLTDSGMSAARECKAVYREGRVHAEIVAEWKGPLLDVAR